MPDTPPSRLIEGKAISARLDAVAEASDGASEVMAVLDGLSIEELRAVILYGYWSWQRDEWGSEVGERAAQKHGREAADNWLAA